ncbi:hypothetical protein EVAR_86754_1 [Eumeta japonica]|uniref:Uncharacterized protein n=1 Tax=Eumeta variegata TaxID=151549 RepID=A0A4C1W0B7_EUMVA|nr:hypothetical protein EVAR_86754_1 [Eumeta japonica]
MDNQTESEPTVESKLKSKTGFELVLEIQRLFDIEDKELIIRPRGLSHGQKLFSIYFYLFLDSNSTRRLGLFSVTRRPSERRVNNKCLRRADGAPEVNSRTSVLAGR